MRTPNTIHKLRDARRKNNATVFNAYDPPMMVCPMELLTNLYQTGTRLKEVSMEKDTCTFKQLLSDASIVERFAIPILGENRTTSFGET